MRKLFEWSRIFLITLSFTYAALIFIFVSWKPSFVSPIRTGEADLPIRNDVFGKGHYWARRGKLRRHVGIDLKAEINSPVRAAKSGWAVCKNSQGGYGKLITIYHLDGFQTRYAHLSGFKVRSQWVYRGNIIGYIGKTGNSNYEQMKPHLHFEIRRRKRTLDPVKFI